MLLKRENPKAAFELYIWAKGKKFPVKRNTVRCLMISQTEREAVAALIAKDSEYACLRQPEVSFKFLLYQNLIHAKMSSRSGDFSFSPPINDLNELKVKIAKFNSMNASIAKVNFNQ